MRFLSLVVFLFAVFHQSKRPGLFDREYELEDTAAFDEGYFDIVVMRCSFDGCFSYLFKTEFAKSEPDCVFIRVTAKNVGPDSSLVLLPQLTFRNTWAWGLNENGFRAS